MAVKIVKIWKKNSKKQLLTAVFLLLKTVTAVFKNDCFSEALDPSMLKVIAFYDLF